MHRVRLPAQPIETVRAADRSASGTSSRNSGERQSSSEQLQGAAVEGTRPASRPVAFVAGG